MDVYIIKTMSKGARQKGHNYERQLAKEFREMGFDAKTSRYASREKDDQKVDLIGTDPFSIQAKAWKSAPSYHKVLDEMPKDTNYNLIFHKRPHQGEVVVMRKEDFYELLLAMKNEKIIIQDEHKPESS